MNKRIKGRPETKNETPKREFGASERGPEKKMAIAGELPAYEERQIHRPHKEEGGHARRAS